MNYGFTVLVHPLTQFPTQCANFLLEAVGPVVSEIGFPLNKSEPCRLSNPSPQMPMLFSTAVQKRQTFDKLIGREKEIRLLQKVCQPHPKDMQPVAREEQK
jgi:hypothetical protein